MVSSDRSTSRRLLDLVATLMMILASATIVWFLVSPSKMVVNRPRTSEAGTVGVPDEPLSLRGSVVKGSPNATVAVIEYSNFRCTYCGGFARDVLPEIRRRYIEPGRLLYAFRPLISRQHDPEAFQAAEAVMCGERQGKFWEMHAALFEEPSEFGRRSLIQRALDAGLDTAGFSSCIDGQTRELLEASVLDARRLKITGTPTFIFGRLEVDGHVRAVQRKTGALTLEAFEGILREVASQ